MSAPENTDLRDPTYRELAHKLVEECEQAKGPTMRATIIARGLATVAQASEEVYEKLLATRPPPPCTGAGLLPPLYQGMVGCTSLNFEPAPCAICGQQVAVDGHMLTVNHPYRPVTP